MRTRGSPASGAFVNQVLVYMLVAICGSATIGMGTVWMRHQISIAANANKALEAAIADVERRIEETDAAIAAEQDPAVLTRRNTEWQLGLVPPDETQVRHVAVDPVTRLTAIHNQALFGDTGSTVTIHFALGH